jgi:hypothetical protein
MGMRRSFFGHLREIKIQRKFSLDFCGDLGYVAIGQTENDIMKKFLLICTAVLMTASTAFAEERSACQGAIILNGIDFRGSIVCNPDWLDRRGSLVILAMAQSCKNKSGSKISLARGFADFDNSVKELGKTAACQKLDDTIRSMETDQ